MLVPSQEQEDKQAARQKGSGTRQSQNKLKSYLHSRKDSLRSWESRENEALEKIKNTMQQHVDIRRGKHKKQDEGESQEGWQVHQDIANGASDQALDFMAMDINDFVGSDLDFNSQLHSRGWKWFLNNLLMNKTNR